MADSLLLLRRRALALCLSGALLGTVLPVAPARAWCYACEVECSPAAPSAWGAATATVGGAVETMGFTIANSIRVFSSMLQLLAADRANTTQAKNNTQVALNDREVSHAKALGTTQTRSELLKSTMPSSQACALSTSSEKIAGRATQVGTSVKAAEGQSTALLSNASGTAAETGELAYVSSRFKTRADKYCDPKEISGCTPSVATNADLNVAPIFTKTTFSGTELDTARDAVSNLIGEVVDDPVRGPALATSTGQTAMVVNKQRQARANLSAAVLTNIVEARAADASGNSQNKEDEELARVDTAVGANSLVLGQGQTDGQSEAEIDAAMEAISNQLLKLRGTFEKIAMIRAVGMATDIQVNKKIGMAAAIGMKGN